MDSKVTGGKQDVQIKWGGEASLRRWYLFLFLNEEKKATMTRARKKHSGKRTIKCQGPKVGEGEDFVD